MTALHYIVGLKFEVRGQHHLHAAQKNGPVLIACKHQSAFETIIPSLLFENFVIVLKRELVSIPIFGLYLKKLSAISIDRTKGASAIKTLIKSGKSAIANGQNIFIFPEGQRSKPGARGAYQPGIKALYALNVPVVPVALNSGVFWGRRSFVKKPGLIVIEFLPAIPGKLDRDAFMNQLETAIENKSQELFEAATTSEPATIPVESGQNKTATTPGEPGQSEAKNHGNTPS